jgi:hypothetical protein
MTTAATVLVGCPRLPLLRSPCAMLAARALRAAGAETKTLFFTGQARHNGRVRLPWRSDAT